MRPRWQFLALLALLPAATAAASCPPSGGTPTGPFPYPQTPDWESVKGYTGTGLAFADLDNDGWKDMVVSNGNDIAQQTLAVRYNGYGGQPGCFNPEADWQSADHAFNGNLAVGDVDGNGWVDVVVTVFTGPEHTYTGGGAKVYFNQGPPEYLEATPSWQVTGFPAFNASLGDADGDGDLDVAIAVGNPIAETETFAAQTGCKGPGFTAAGGPSVGEEGVVGQEPPYSSNVFVFYYDGEKGNLQTTPGWTSVPKLVSMDVQFADVNKDGTADLIFGDPHTAVFFGHPVIGLDRRPGWRSAVESYTVNQLDYAATLDVATTDAKARVATIAASGNNYMGGGPGRFDVFRFTSPYIYDYTPRTASPTWSSPGRGWGSDVKMVDLDDDGDLDLLSARWAPPGSGVLGAPVEIYPGDGVGFADAPAYVSDSSSVLEILAVADLAKRDVRSARQTFTPEEGESWAVLTLDRQTVETVESVSVDGSALEPGTQWSWAPGTNVIYLDRRIGYGDTATVAYTWSRVLDLGATNWDCGIGDYLFYSRAASFTQAQSEEDDDD